MVSSKVPPGARLLDLSLLSGAATGDDAEELDHSGEVLAVRGDRERFVSGEISEADFVEREVERATAHLADHLPLERLEAVRAILRDEMSENPVFRDLLDRVRQSA